MATTLECPVDFITINENKVRLTALNVFILAVVCIIFPNWIIPAFLLADFYLRAFGFGKYSLLNFISQKGVQLFSVKSIPIDQAPKRFAAKIGFIFSAAIFAFSILNFSITALVLTIILALFAFLESVFGFCAGCYIYTFYINLFLKK